MNCRNPHAKSCIRVYNDATQILEKDPQTLILEGTPEVYSGCSLDLTPKAIIVNNRGLYHFAADMTYVPKDGVEGLLQLYIDGVPIPSAATRFPVDLNPVPVHVETELCLDTCRMNRPKISAVVSGVTGNIEYLSMGALKLA